MFLYFCSIPEEEYEEEEEGHHGERCNIIFGSIQQNEPHSIFLFSFL